MRIWTALEALSWAMYGDETKLTLCPSAVAANNLTPPHRTYDTARRELRCAIARGAIEARGFKIDHRQPTLAREPLIPDLFQKYPALAVDAYGETTFMHPASPQPIPEWRDIVFVEDEIRALWPKPKPNLDEWMRRSVATHPNEKRDSRISDCKKTNGCTFRDAKAAYNRLPQNLRPGRGRKIVAK
jgi:hypothetical protein